MTQYEELDRLILNAISRGIAPLYERHVCGEAGRIAVATGRDEFRVIDGRISALRARGDITFDKATRLWLVLPPRSAQPSKGDKK